MSLSLPPRPMDAAPRGGPTQRRVVQGLLALCVALPPLLALPGCALQPPQPWEKGLLARPDMGFDGDALEQRIDEHIHASREAASGRGAAGGAGCGCH